MNCFTSTETVQTIWDGEPRTATSTFTQLLNSERVEVGHFNHAEEEEEAPCPVMGRKLVRKTLSRCKAFFFLFFSIAD